MSTLNLKLLSLSTVVALAALTSGCNDSEVDKVETPEQEVEAPSEGELANDNFVNKLSGQELVNELQAGGYVVYFRHAKTEIDYADQVKAEMGKCNTQRTLSEEGWNQSFDIRDGFKKFNLPVAEVVSSQYCRAWQTATLAFGKYDRQEPKLNFPKAADYTDAQVAQMKADLDPMLSKVPAAGKNTVIVGHDDLFESSTGIYPRPQGVAYVVKPNGSSYKVMTKVLPPQWKDLVNLK